MKIILVSFFLFFTSLLFSNEAEVNIRELFDQVKSSKEFDALIEEHFENSTPISLADTFYVYHKALEIKDEKKWERLVQIDSWFGSQHEPEESDLTLLSNVIEKGVISSFEDYVPIARRLPEEIIKKQEVQEALVKFTQNPQKNLCAQLFSYLLLFQHNEYGVYKKELLSHFQSFPSYVDVDLCSVAYFFLRL